MKDAEGVLAEGGVGVLVFEGLGLLFVLLVLGLSLGGWWFDGVVV